MGKATRWLKGMFSGGGGKNTKWVFAKSSNKAVEVGGEDRSGFLGGGSGGGGGGFVGKCGEGGGDEQNRRAIAVAEATAAMAEAAVAAAHAAAAVARLTSGGPARRVVSGGGRPSERWAAVRIQSAFRGYLSRKALKALKGLVKLQALVRGHIIRKQTAEALRCIQSLVRVQARARACRLLADDLRPGGCTGSATCHHGRSVRGKYNQVCGERKKTLGRTLDHNRSSWHCSTNWLDHWKEERFMDSHETMSRAGTPTTDDDKHAKILEIDMGKSRFTSHRHRSMSTDLNYWSFMTELDSPSKDSTVAQGSDSSPPSVGNWQHPETHESAHRHLPACARFTPSSSHCSGSIGGGDHPSYMAYTQSSRAKARSQSVPRQRPASEKTCSAARRASGGHTWHCPSSEGSYCNLHLGKAYPGSGRLDRMGMPV